jgi:hypothetical protein
MAIRPERGCRETHYVAADHPVATLRPLWIKCLLPPWNAELIGFERAAPAPWSFDTSEVRCAVPLESWSDERCGLQWPFDATGPLTDDRPRYGANYVDRTSRPREDPLWLPSPERIDPNTGKPELYWGDLPEIQWFHANDKLLDPTTRDLRQHYDVDPTAGKPRRE